MMRVASESNVALGEQQQKTYTMVGPVRSMAPESISDQVFSGKSDIFSFAVLVIEVYTAAPVWGAVPATQVIKRVLCGERLPVPTNVPPMLGTLITESFDEDPEVRERTMCVCDSVFVCGCCGCCCVFVWRTQFARL